MVKRITMAIMRLVVATFSALVMLIACLLISLCLLIMTETGRVFVVEKAAQFAPSFTAFQVELQDVTAPKLGHWGFASIHVTQNGSPVFSAQALEFEWVPEKVLQRLEINRLTADELSITIPEAAEKVEEEPAKPFELPQWDYPVALRNINIEQLLVHDVARARSQRFHIVGDVLLLTENAPLIINAAIESLDSPHMKLAIATEGGENNQWHIRMKLNEAAGGMVGEMLRLPPSQPLQVDATLNVQPAMEDAKSWQVELNPLITQYGDYPLNMQMRVQLWPEQQRATITDGVLRVGDATQRFDGEISKQNVEFLAELKAFPLGLVAALTNQAISGTLDGHVQVNGTPEKPILAATIKAKGAYEKRDFTAQTDFSYRKAALQVNKLTLTMFGTSLNASGTLQENIMDFNIHADDVPTSIANLFGYQIYPGVVSASANIHGSFEDPAIQGSARYTSEVAPQIKTAKRRRISVAMDFTTKDQWFVSDVAIQQNKRQVGTLEIRLPKDLPSRFADKEKMKLDGNVTADFALEDLDFLFSPLHHELRGRLNADVAVGGTVSSPSLDGRVLLKEGKYEHRLLGLSLESLNLAMKLSGTQMTIEDASAVDGEGGTLALQGSANWGVLQGADRMDLTLRVKDMNLVQRHDIEAYATGKLQLHGNFKTLNLTGNVDISPLTILLDTLTQGANIPEIDVTDVYGRRGERKNTETVMPEVKLDVTISAKNKAFLRGFGLDAELAGDVQVAGTLDAPKMVGSLSTTRGFYSLLGKRFKLGEGRVEFQNSDVWFTIPGDYSRKGRDIRAVISGTPQDLDIALSSNPSMPEDEIVSWLLFGKSAGNISPFQAIRLANAVSSLRQGQKSIFDPVGLARDVLNVDTISIDTEGGDSGDDVTVGVGKYINDRVYLEVGKGSDPAQPVQGKLEIELLPNVNLESNTASGEAGVGNLKLQWKRDY